MSAQVSMPKVKLTTAALESLDGMSSRSQEALAKLQDFDYGAVSSNGWSVDQKIWGIGVAIVVIKDILSSPDVAKAFRIAKMNVENWMEHANLLKPYMNVSRYLPPMQDPLLRQEVLARHYHWLEFNLPAAPEHLQKFLPKLERYASVEESDEKETDSREGTESGLVDEIANSFCNIKID